MLKKGSYSLCGDGTVQQSLLQGSLRTALAVRRLGREPAAMSVMKLPTSPSQMVPPRSPALGSEQTKGAKVPAESMAPPRSGCSAAQQSIAITSFNHQYGGFAYGQHVNNLFSYLYDQLNHLH